MKPKSIVAGQGKGRSEGTGLAAGVTFPAVCWEEGVIGGSQVREGHGSGSLHTFLVVIVVVVVVGGV